MADITFDNGCYTVKFGYDPVLVTELKNTIPNTGRKWEGSEKSWKVDAKHFQALRQLFPDDSVPMPVLTTLKTEYREIDLRYVGQVKDRGNGEFSAFGYSNGNWTVVFSEQVLREWFEGTAEHPKVDMSTLYGILGVSTKSSADEIKAGYRRMVRQWHPDVCKEPNANEMFLDIRNAYDILSDAGKKVRYDVGLKFENRLEKKLKKSKYDNNGYRAPLRCGNIRAEGSDVLGRFVVSKILGWDDIVDQHGRTLVVSWVMGDDKPLEAWF